MENLVDAELIVPLFDPQWRLLFALSMIFIVM
jgi:hypothetical protein